MEFAIGGRLAGPLDFIMVSRYWRSALLNSPSLWTQIYIQNGEGEIARISTFLQVSKQCQLHIDIMTGFPSVISLRLVAEHISRVRTISIRPGPSDTFRTLQAEQWNRTAAHILDILSNGMQLSNVEPPECFGVTIWGDGQLYYRVILLQFTIAATVDEPNRMWENMIAKYALFVSDLVHSSANRHQKDHSRS
jgi:hypothetical protein